MKFFNTIRRRILGKGFGKYLIYALGEIILVVIGILLAIGINDHYAKKELDKNNHENAIQIYKQMQSDSTEVATYIEYLSELRQTIKYLQASEKDQKELKKPLTEVKRFTLFYDRDSDFINLSNLVPTQIQNGNFSSTKYAQLLFNIQVDYSNDLRGIYDQEDIIQDNNKRFNSYLADNYAWYTEWSSNLNCNSDCIDFINNSKRFNGMLALYSYEKTVIYEGRIKDFEDNLHWNMGKLRFLLQEE